MHEKKAGQHSGILYIVATPIGNLEDITLRALRILKEVDLIAAEDTRHSKKLLNHFGIHTPLISYYREKEQERSLQLLSHLEEGRNIALISDAGTPAISDPGAVFVRLAHERGMKIVPLPGASAAITALSAAGLPFDTFLFMGFPPVKKGQRATFLNSLVNCDHPVVLYESPKRITSFLADALEVLGDRDAFWAREITKSYEELLSSSLKMLLEESKSRKNMGEFVLIICPGKKEEVSGSSLEELLIWYRDNSQLSLKDVSKQLAADLGLSRSKVYKTALTIWKQ